MALAQLLFIAGVYLVMSLIAVVIYGIDKRRAERGGWRIPERTLHLLELLGGWPGALLAQRMFRHKRWKLSFMLVFWAIVALHVAGWVAVYRIAHRS
jgi:uncharacterized membrane protein YsdA (DUF1294 family)